MSNIERIYQYIDEHFDEHVKRIQEYLRQPSISSTGLGMKETAEMNCNYIRNLLGGEARNIATSGYPVSFGKLKSKTSNRTLFAYGMYDTQPIEPVDKWTSPPHEAKIVGDRIIARGAINSKGPLMGFFNALKSIKDVTGDLPFNFIVGVEGEEEQGSVHIPEFAEKCSDELKKCEAIYMAQPSQWVKGARPVLTLGFKGVVYLELECTTNPLDVHSSQAAILPNPIWRMIWALNSMRGEDGVLVEGFYENVEPPSEEDLNNVDSNADSIVKMMTSVYDVRQYRGTNIKVMARELIFEPSPINLAGAIGGWTGPATKTIVPSKILVKVDVRLVPNMTGEEVVEKIKKHLNRHGFGDIEVRVLCNYGWVKTSVKEKISQAAIKMFREFGHEPIILPMMPGSAPMYLFCKEPFNMKMMFGGLGHGGLAHAPNEYFTVEGIRAFEKSVVSFLYNYAQM
ncbi:MAG: M20/M25/M40 family metallo-hydrolase [Nitrososphaeria archaeon]|jgi:acetylornithine deacetylase/succinyl-diaminopimelate desuccinylase-like protein